MVGVATGRVLVVDDEETIRSFLRTALEDEGFDVETAVNGASAVSRAMAARPDLVILDMMLPDMAGEAVADELRAQLGGDVPILVITADQRASERAARTGAFAYLRKPFDLDELVNLVQRGLAN